MPHVLVRICQAQLAALNRRVAEQHQEKLYRPTVGVIAENGDGEILLILSRKSGTWIFPQGGVDSDEDIVDGLVRELFEETRVVPTEIRKFCLEDSRDIPGMNHDGFTRGRWYYYFHVVCAGVPAVTPQPGEVDDCVWLAPEAAARVLSTLDDTEKREMMLGALRKATGLQ